MESKKEVQRRLENKILNQLKVNFVEGYYPAVSRPVISLLGLIDETSDRPKIDNEESRFANTFYSFIKKHFKTLYNEDKERALDKLPSDVEYDEKNSCLIQSRSIHRTWKLFLE